MKKSTALSFFYLLVLIASAVSFGFFLSSKSWLQTDLHALLPEEQQWTAIQVNADKKQEATLNQQIIALVGTNSLAQSQQFTQEIAQKWQTSGLFTNVISQIQPNVAQLQNEINFLKLATLPNSIRRQLLTDPKSYFQQYAEHIINPFNQTNLLPIVQDWLGFGRFTQSQLTSEKIRWDSQTGAVYIEAQGIYWVLLRGELQSGNLINPNVSLMQLIDENRQFAQTENADFLVTGSALFAANAKEKTEQESQIMSILGMGLTLLLLIICFRTLRVLWLFLPILTGLLLGVVATIFCFGQIHILTLAIGTSLIGVLVDFPLHWLASSLFVSRWQGDRAMQRLRFTFFISLLVTLLGYGLLGFTTLSVLKQTALFSAVSLIGAMLSTLLFLPRLFCTYQPRNFTLPHIFQWRVKSLHSIEKGITAIFVLFVTVGIFKSQWRDDIRQWVAMPQEMLMEAQKIGELTGIDLGSQYFLLTASDEDSLLEKDQKISEKLRYLQSQQPEIRFQSLSQWLMTTLEQREFAKKLAQTFNVENIQPLVNIGIPANTLQQAVDDLSQNEPISLQQALNTQIGQGYRHLFLGKIKNQYVSLIKVNHIHTDEMASLAEPNQGIYWQDKREHLNQSFQHTRNQAAWLKLFSFLLAGLLLVKFFGRKKTLGILFIPLCAIICTIGILGWLNLPISLFTMFGLLLVSAIGIDYTAYMQTAQEPTSQKRIAVLLAASTTLISFLLLGISSTPAVASFGLSVSIGVALSVLFSLRFLR